jgi:hypothetical protein
MIRAIRMPALALGAVLAVNGVAAAQTGSPAKSGFSSGTTMTLGGTGTAAQAAAEDTELTGGHGGGGYHGGGYHGGFHGGYHSGFYGGYHGYYHAAYHHAYYHNHYGYGYGFGLGIGIGFYPGYYPAYYPSYYSAYPVYSDPYAYPVDPGYVSPGVGVSVGVGVNRISGDQSAVNAPVVALSMNISKSATAQPSPAAQAGGFRYDGGPANPVPLPRPDANPAAAAAPPATGLPVSLPKAKPTSPYTFKAYGEK